MTGNKNPLYPAPFLYRRLHSLTGLFIALFLIQHLFVNAQAALIFGEDGKDFIHSVNSIHALPWLNVVEVLLLAVPILIHMLWGVLYLREAKFNSSKGDGTAPALPEYNRNVAYTWQRITSWMLLIAIVAHVTHMRFMKYPEKVSNGYVVQVEKDMGYQTLAPRLSVELFEKEGQVYATAPDFGTAELLVVRETFKDPVLMALYTLFVLAACFHGFNGFWTFMISWGVTLSRRSQACMLYISHGFMVVVALLGLMAIFGTYWINLYS